MNVKDEGYLVSVSKKSHCASIDSKAMLNFVKHTVFMKENRFVAHHINFYLVFFFKGMYLVSIIKH